MKSFLLFLFCSLSYFSIYCQEVNLAFNINDVKVENENITPEIVLRINNKVKQIMTSNGVSNVANGFTLTSSFTVDDISKIENANGNLYMSTGTLSLVVKEDFSQKSFGSFFVQVKGTGNSITASISQSVNAIKIRDKKISDFIASLSNSILNYYNANCLSILQRARTLSEGKNDHEQAIALLSSISPLANCYGEVSVEMERIYSKYQNFKCEKQLLLAETYLLTNKYAELISLLKQIEPNSKCSAAFQSLISKIDKEKIDSKLQQDYVLMLERLKNENTLRKTYIEASRDIMVEYYKKNPINIIKL